MIQLLPQRLVLWKQLLRMLGFNLSFLPGVSGKTLGLTGQSRIFISHRIALEQKTIF